MPVVCKPNCTLYEWYYDEGKLLPVISINKLPAPTNMTPLTICSCKSTCNSNRCRCKKRYLNCSDACKCLNCENVPETKYSKEQVADSNSDDIWSLSWKIETGKLEFWMTCFNLGVNFYSILITFHNLFLNFFPFYPLERSQSQVCFLWGLKGEGGKWRGLIWILKREKTGFLSNHLDLPTVTSNNDDEFKKLKVFQEN